MRSEWWWPVVIEGYQIQARGKVGTGGTRGKVRNSGVLADYGPPKSEYLYW